MIARLLDFGLETAIDFFDEDAVRAFRYEGGSLLHFAVRKNKPGLIRLQSQWAQEHIHDVDEHGMTVFDYPMSDEIADKLKTFNHRPSAGLF
jgi:hypothetical protein